MGIWKYYRLDFNSTGTWAAPSSSYEYDRTYNANSTVAYLRHWKLRKRADAPIITEDTETGLFVQIDSSSTWLVNNGSTAFTIYVTQCPVPGLAEDLNFGSSATLGGICDSSSAGAFVTIVGKDALRASSYTSDPPPAVKVRLKDTDTTAAKCHVFLGFRQKI